MVHGALQRFEVAGGIDARGFEHQRAGHPQRRVSRRVHAVMRDRLFEGAAGIRQGVAAQRGQLATALAECVIRIESRMCGEGVVRTIQSLNRGDEAIAAVANRFDERLVRVLAQRPAQARNRLLHAVVGNGHAAPARFCEGVLVHHVRRARHQLEEQGGLRVGETDALRSGRQLSIRRIKLERAEAIDQMRGHERERGLGRRPNDEGLRAKA
jgi:hypothetical protein